MSFSALREWFGGRADAAGALLSAPAPSALDPAMLEPARFTAEPATSAPPPPQTPEPWSWQRLEIAQSLWGEGNHAPGFAEDVLRVAIPLGVRDGAELLLLGGGCGGGAVRLAQRLGVRVCAHEADATLRAAFTRHVQQAGPDIARRIKLGAATQGERPARPPPSLFAVAFERLAGDGVAAAFGVLAAALRPGGQLALLQTVATDALDPAGAAVQAWRRLERSEPPRLSEATLLTYLGRLGFDVRTTEDWSARQTEHAVAGWNRMVQGLESLRHDPRRAAALVAEAELWLHRIHLLRSGQMRYLRLHAIRADAKPAA